jgi:hypothetical protein
MPNTEPLANEQIVWGGRRLSGFIVVPDAAAHPSSVPTLSLSQFDTLFEWLGSELGPLDDELRARAPFALVFGQNLKDGIGEVYIAPVSALERSDVRAWRFRLENAPDKALWRKWLQPVATAEPVPSP